MIRKGQTADIATLIDIELAAGEMFADTHMAWAVGDAPSPEQFETAIARGDLWVVETDGATAGFLITDVRDETLFIAQVSIAPPFQRRGLGKSLLDEACREARGRGHRAVTLTTDRTIPWNAPYYERLGFRILAEHEMPPALAAQLASEPFPEKRCAMRLAL